MDIQTEKHELVKRIINIDDALLIERLIEAIDAQKESYNEPLNEYVKEEIELGLNELNNGNRIHFDDFLKKIS